MASAFQSNALQNNAFQIDVAPPSDSGEFTWWFIARAAAQRRKQQRKRR